MRRTHSYYMDIAINEALMAKEKGEVPVGAVIVKGEQIIAIGQNTRENKNNALGHAEISAINAACTNLNSWRLEGCTLYVTLEPCPMCMGALINSRIDTVIFGAWDLKAGCCGSVVDFNQLPFNHKCRIIGGIREMECAKLLSGFFTQIRK